MSSSLLENETWSVLNCQPYERSWLTALMALFRAAPTIITWALYIAGFYYKELYLFYFGIGLWLNSLLNQLLNDLVVRAPRVPTCPPPHGAAFAWQVQQMAFFTTFVLGYSALYRPCVNLWHIGLVQMLFMLTVVGSDMLNYQHTDAIVSGAAAGNTFALVYSSAGYFFVVPWFKLLLSNRFVRYMAYEDKMCAGSAAVPRHVVVLESFDRRFGHDRPLTHRIVREFIATEVH